MGEIFLNHNHLGNWIAQAEEIRTSRGTYQALHYLIGEKFFNLASLCRFFRDEAQTGPSGTHLFSHGKAPALGPEDLNAGNDMAVSELEDMLAEFAALINQSFEGYLIRGYFAADLHGKAAAGIAGPDSPARNGATPDPSAIWKDVMEYLSA